MLQLCILSLFCLRPVLCVFKQALCLMQIYVRLSLNFVHKSMRYDSLQFHLKARKNEVVCLRSISCLVQLSSLNGPVLEKRDNAVTYLTRFLQGFLQVFAK